MSATPAGPRAAATRAALLVGRACLHVHGEHADGVVDVGEDVRLPSAHRHRHRVSAPRYAPRVAASVPAALRGAGARLGLVAVCDLLQPQDVLQLRVRLHARGAAGAEKNGSKDGSGAPPVPEKNGSKGGADGSRGAQGGARRRARGGGCAGRGARGGAPRRASSCFRSPPRCLTACTRGPVSG